MAVIPVATPGGAYEVRIAPGLLARAAEECAPLLRKREAVVVTDANVARHWRTPVEASFAAAGMTTHWFELPSGEASKSWAQLVELLEWLLAREVERGEDRQHGALVRAGAALDVDRRLGVGGLALAA